MTIPITLFKIISFQINDKTVQYAILLFYANQHTLNVYMMYDLIQYDIAYT